MCSYVPVKRWNVTNVYMKNYKIDPFINLQKGSWIQKGRNPIQHLKFRGLTLEATQDLWLFQDTNSSTITPRYSKDLFCSRIQFPKTIRTSLAILSALCRAITIDTVVFVLQITPLFEDHSLILYSASPTTFELKWILVSSANSVTLELWHALDMFMDIKQRWTQDRLLRDSKREMSKLRRGVSTHNKLTSF